jgi:hypothetical protein
LTFWGCSMKWWKLNCRGEMDSKFSLNAVCLCTKVFVRFGTEGHDYWLSVHVYTASYSRKSYSSCIINSDYFAKQH